MDEKHKMNHQRKSTKMTIIVYLCLLFLSLLSCPLPPTHLLSSSISLFPKYPKKWPLCG